ncbi:MAG: winged helix-turn-helix domain-containing protein [Acidobacteria bacterium]|nr:winged helix-turn-helix domain-containing protein [Acidobacteriota bacterium]
MLYEFNGFRFDSEMRSLQSGERDVQLTPKTRDLLVFFLRNPSRPLSRQEILDAVWPGVAVGYEALSFQVSELRKALGEKAELVRTLSRKGYVWEGGPPSAPRPQVGEHEQPEAAVTPTPPEAARPAPVRRRWLMVAVVGPGILLSFVLYFLRGGWSEEGWVLAFEDDFERADLGSEYRSMGGTWEIDYGGLRGGGAGGVAVALTQRFEGDVRVELDATMLAGSWKREIAIWLLSSHLPGSSGYYLGLGADHEVVEIERNDIEMSIARVPAIEAGRPYHIGVTRSGSRLGIEADGKLLTSFDDPIALNPTRVSVVKLTTYDGIIRIDNLRIYRARIPAAIQPTVPADRLFERGDLDGAQAEYDRVARDRAGEAVGGEALFKDGLCLLEKGRPADAAQAFRAVADSAANSFFKTLASLNVGKTLMVMGELDAAFAQFRDLEQSSADGQARYAIANELLLLASRYGEMGDRTRAAEVRRFVVAHFQEHPLLVERAATYLALFAHDDPRDVGPLIQFLDSGPRVGKARLLVEQCIGMIRFLGGDEEGALEAYRRIEKDFAGVNVRFSLQGVSGQALILAAIGRSEESKRVAQRLKAGLPGEPQPAWLYTEWAAFERWAADDIAGAAGVLEQAIPRAVLQDVSDRMGRLEVALLLDEAGETVRSRAMLTSLSLPLSNPNAPGDDQAVRSEAGKGGDSVSKTAALFLGDLSPDRYAGDVSIPYEDRQLTLARFYSLRGHKTDAVEILRAFDPREVTEARMTSALGRAYVILNEGMHQPDDRR